MELTITTPHAPNIPAEALQNIASSPFIEANTIQYTLEEIREKHIIPVFIKDSEPVISQVEFIEAGIEIAEEIYVSERILAPNIRLSHLLKAECRKRETSLPASCWSMENTIL